MIRSALDAAKAAAWITRALYHTCRQRGAPLLLEDPRQVAGALVYGYRDWIRDHQGRPSPRERARCRAA